MTEQQRKQQMGQNDDFKNEIPYRNYDDSRYANYYQENIPDNFRSFSTQEDQFKFNYDPGTQYFEYPRTNVANYPKAAKPPGFVIENNEFNNMRLDEDSTPVESARKKTGRKKITMEYIEGKNKRSVTFSKRKKGIMKKAYELNILTGTQILLLVASESGHVYTFATPKLKPIISNHERLIQQCLNAPNTPPQPAPHIQPPCPSNQNMNPNYRYKSADEDEEKAYYSRYSSYYSGGNENK